MFHLIKPDINLPFIPNMSKLLGISGVLFTLAVITIAIRGFNYGIDFAGGTEVMVRFNKNVTSEDVRSAVDKVGHGGAAVQEYGSSEKNEFLVRLPNISFVTPERESKLESGLKQAFGDKGFRRYAHSTEGGDKVEFTLNSEVKKEDVKAAFAKAELPTGDVTISGTEGRFVVRAVLEGLGPKILVELDNKFGKGTATIMRMDTVGPAVGHQLREKAILALIYSFVGIMIYVAFRFQWQFAPGAVLSLIHDVVIVAGLYSFFQIEFDVPTIAALLTLVGYSINDTIVVYDRIREDIGKTRTKPLEVVCNDAINQTLSRTLITSGVTMLSVIAILIFGGPTLFTFSFAMTIGIVIGTYSSIFVATPFMIYIERWTEKRALRQKMLQGSKPAAK